MSTVTREIIGALKDAGVSQPYRRRMRFPIQQFCERLGAIRGVKSLEIGFANAGSAQDRWDFDEYPADGVVHLVTVVNGTNPKVVREVGDAEIQTYRRYPTVPIEFHIAEIKESGKRKAADPFPATVPEGTLHLHSVDKTTL
jgi:hypothetical protein